MRGSHTAPPFQVSAAAAAAAAAGVLCPLTTWSEEEEEEEEEELFWALGSHRRRLLNFIPTGPALTLRVSRVNLS